MLKVYLITGSSYSNPCGGCGGNYGGSGYSSGGNAHGGGSSYAGGNGGYKYRSAEAQSEDVGSSYTGSYESYQAPVPEPSYSLSYPSPAPQVKCGSNLLIGCTPSTQVVPCSSYSPPSYGASY